MFLGYQNNKIAFVAQTREELENLPLVKLDSIKETDIVYELYNGEYLALDEIKEKEQERIKKLKATKRVFAIALGELGINYNQLKELIATNEQAQLEWDLCVELERSNPLLDSMAIQMNITPEKLDNIFLKANEVKNLD